MTKTNTMKLNALLSGPVAQAVAPLKEAAVERAAKFAGETVARVLAELAAVDWDLNKIAPRVKTWNRKEYAIQNGRRSLYLAIVAYDRPRTGCWTDATNIPNYYKASPEMEAAYIEGARKDAAAQYDAFVAKLVEKLGAGVATAVLTGDHVWGHSVLTVTREDGAVERWKTQTILNVSVLGKVFNQWPTRRMK